MISICNSKVPNSVLIPMTEKKNQDLCSTNQIVYSVCTYTNMTVQHSTSVIIQTTLIFQFSAAVTGLCAS
jgi:hypothetical protein